jgi:hypothetical protein
MDHVSGINNANNFIWIDNIALEFQNVININKDNYESIFRKRNKKGAIQMTAYPYTYAWGNNPVRAKLKGRRCRVIVRGKMNSCLLEFESGEMTVTSRNAIRRVK